MLSNYLFQNVCSFYNIRTATDNVSANTAEFIPTRPRSSSQGHVTSKSYFNYIIAKDAFMVID